MSKTVFFYGTLCHIPLLEIVLGRPSSEIGCSPAVLPEHRVSWVKDQPFPMIERAQQDIAQGILVQNLSAGDVARLQFYEGGFAYDLMPVEVHREDQIIPTEVFFPKAGQWQSGARWDLGDWASDWGEMSCSAAREIMGFFGYKRAEEIAHLLPFLRARGWAQQLARREAPARLRRDLRRDDIALQQRDDGYAGFFRLDSFDISYPRFDGKMSATIQRGAFVAYDAALVLPYDPKRDLVLLIEQMRYGPLLRGDPLPWVLEPIAGLVDAGEEPIEAARREAIEEAGLVLSDIRPITKTYASPGYSTEFFHCFLAICDLDPSLAGVHGLASENEDIRSHVVGFDQAMALFESGEINNGPLAMMLLWLAQQRPGFRSLT